MKNIRFRELTLGDLPMFYDWLVSPHVSETYGSARGKAREEVYAKYTKRINGEVPTKCYIFQIDGKDVGHIQVYLYADYPEYNEILQADDKTAGVDLFIGDENFIHKGYGKHVLSEFLRQIVFANPKYESCIMGPYPRNVAGIKTYEKVGFKWIKNIQDEDGEEYIMKLDKTDFKPFKLLSNEV